MASTRLTPRLLSGFRDYLPEQMIPRQRMVDTIRRVFESYGFVPLETPALEYTEVLLGKGGGETEKQVYRFMRGERDICLRYDLTVPLARVAAQYPELPKPFKRYQIAPVWRGERKQRGRFREFTQCDVDTVGSDSPLADAEVLDAGINMLLALGIERFVIRMSSRKLLNGLCAAQAVSTPEQIAAVGRVVDALPKTGAEAVEQGLREEAGLGDAARDAVMGLVTTQGAREAVFAALAERLGSIPLCAEGVADLRLICGLADAAGVAPERLVVDPSIVRGLDYYTGAVFETFLDDLPGFGSIMSGGRYDGLVGRFAKQDLPAVGISLGLDRLFAALEELGLTEPAGATASVLITVFSAETAGESLKLANELRAAGIPAEVYVVEARLGRQLEYAAKRGLRWALILGPDELAAGQVVVRDIAAGEQQTVARGDAAAWLAGP